MILAVAFPIVKIAIQQVVQHALMDMDLIIQKNVFFAVLFMIIVLIVMLQVVHNVKSDIFGIKKV